MLDVVRPLRIKLEMIEAARRADGAIYRQMTARRRQLPSLCATWRVGSTGQS
jgi:hypothetical protein